VADIGDILEIFSKCRVSQHNRYVCVCVCLRVCVQNVRNAILVRKYINKSCKVTEKRKYINMFRIYLHKSLNTINKLTISLE